MASGCKKCIGAGVVDAVFESADDYYAHIALPHPIAVIPSNDAPAPVEDTGGAVLAGLQGLGVVGQ